MISNTLSTTLRHSGADKDVGPDLDEDEVEVVAARDRPGLFLYSGLLKYP